LLAPIEVPGGMTRCRMIHRPALFVVLAILGAASVPPIAASAAQVARGCTEAETPVFRDAFAVLKADLGPVMGEPVSCWYVRPGEDPVFQDTTAGLAYHYPGPWVTVFTDGYRHWAITPDGPVYWEGASSRIPEHVCAWKPGGDPTVAAWWLIPGRPLWTVIVGSFETREEAERLGVAMCVSGLSAGVVYSSDFASLAPGYWVTHSGAFSDGGQAAGEAGRLRALGFADAYPRELRR